MTARLKDHEWEMLSAYMDGQVSSSDKVQLAERMQADPEMAAAYSSLVKTRVILQAAAKVKRRRNFYLTPEMVRPKGWSWLIPALNFSSVAAAVLAVMLFVLDIFPLAPVMNRASPVPEAAQMVQDSAARPAAAEKIELGITPVPQVAAAQEQDGGNENYVLVPEEPVLPAAKLAGNGASGEVDPALAPVAPVTLQPLLKPTDSISPTLEEAPGEAFAQPSVAQAALPPEAKGMPSPDAQGEITALPKALQIEPAIEPTGLAVEGIAAPTPAIMLATATYQVPAQQDQKMAAGSIKVQPQVVANPANGPESTLIIPTANSVRPDEMVVTVPIPLRLSWVKIGWITLLTISGFLVLLSAILKKKP